ncbi:hypothetical protein ACIQFU_03355 [Streptomyces sp. NPDC093065]|uniref:hypothetical protein n=1 Tax=Streptomyces sp. NPDC093065 TaxID=3366021 RepID=UPI00380CB3BD
MDERRLLNELMKAVGEEAEEFSVRPRFPGLNNPLFLFLHMPDAHERADADRTPLPGMLPGLGLTPVPEAWPQVEILCSRMVVDASGRQSDSS